MAKKIEVEFIKRGSLFQNFRLRGKPNYSVNVILVNLFLCLKTEVQFFLNYLWQARRTRTSRLKTKVQFFSENISRGTEAYDQQYEWVKPKYHLLAYVCRISDICLL